MPDPTIKVRIQADTTQATQELQRSQGRFARFTDFVKSRFVITFSEITRIVQGAFNAIREEAELRGTEQALRLALGRVGADFDDFIDKLKEVSDQQIATADLVKVSARAIALGIDQAQIPALLEQARAASIRLGTDVTRAFDDIATGIGRASPLILDNLGIVVSLEDAYRTYAESVGKTTAELTKQEQTQALLNAVTAQGSAEAQTYIKTQDDLSRAINQSTASMSDFRRIIGQVSGILTLGLAAGLTRLASLWLRFGQGVSIVVQNLAELATKIPIIGGQFIELAEGAERARGKFADLAVSTQEWADKTGDAATAQLQLLLGLREQENVADKLLPKLRDLTNAREDDTAAQEDQADAGEKVRDALEEQAAAFESATDGAREYDEGLGRLESNLVSVERQARTTAQALIETGDAARVLQLGESALRTGTEALGTTGFQFAAGKLTFRNGRLVRVFGDGRVQPA